MGDGSYRHRKEILAVLLKTPGGTVKIPVYRGWMALEVMLPDGVKRSERTDFTVDCNVQPKIREKP